MRVMNSTAANVEEKMEATGPDGFRVSKPQSSPIGNHTLETVILIAYLAAIAFGEVLTIIGNLSAGLTVYLFLLLLLPAHASIASSDRPKFSRLLIALMLAPLLRILSLFLRFWHFTPLQGLSS